MVRTNPRMSEKFTTCYRCEKEHSSFSPLTAWHVFCHYKLSEAERGIWLPCRSRRGTPMAQAATTRLEEPLPLGMAMLSNIALSLFMWNIALRIAGLLLAA